MAISFLSGWQGLVLLLPAILATPPYTVVLADAQPAELLAVVFFAVVLADAHPAALLAPVSFEVVRALCAPLLQTASACPGLPNAYIHDYLRVMLCQIGHQD